MAVLENQRGYVLFPIIMVLSLLSIMLASSIDAFVVEKQFSKEVESKMMTNHLIKLAIKDSRNFLANDMETGDDGILYYENGDVYFRIEEKNKEIFKVLLYASSLSDGKMEISYTYSLEEGKMLQWLEK